MLEVVVNLDGEVEVEIEAELEVMEVDVVVVVEDSVEVIPGATGLLSLEKLCALISIDQEQVGKEMTTSSFLIFLQEHKMFKNSYQSLIWSAIFFIIIIKVMNLQGA